MAGLVNRFASYILRGRRQAITVGLLFVVVPLLSTLSDVVVALVTLRKGAKEGFIVLLWMMLPIAVISALKQPWLASSYIVGSSLLGYFLSLILRQTRSWQRVLEAGMLVGVLVVLCAHLLKPDINAFWLAHLKNYVSLVKEQFNFSISAEQVQVVTKFATGSQIAFLWLGVLINLVLARGLQSMLYNPGKLLPELKAIRLSKCDGFMLLIVGVAGLQKIALAQDALPVMLLGFFLAGLSVLQALVHQRYNVIKSGFLFVCFLLVIFVPYVAITLVLIALADSYLDFRCRVKPKA